MKKSQKNAAGFTLTELVIVMIIVGLLSALALPKFRDFIQKRAIENQEAAIAASMSTAVKTHFLANVASGVDPENAWYSGFPIALLNSPPPYKYWDGTAPDNQNWRTATGSIYLQFVHCPHSNNSNRGRKYVYMRAQDPAITDHKVGDVWLYNDWGH